MMKISSADRENRPHARVIFRKGECLPTPHSSTDGHPCTRPQLCSCLIRQFIMTYSGNIDRVYKDRENRSSYTEQLPPMANAQGAHPMTARQHKLENTRENAF